MNNIKRNYTPKRSEREALRVQHKRPIGGIKQKGSEAENKRQKASIRGAAAPWPKRVLCIIFHDISEHM